ncbi:hypothetical protein N6L24_13720 [Cognatishimia sp. SS12]|uniref:hypothetical protein n=1 Tax=Cognatishimia sp. SS12 TaxID=2979465 RepID=UPI00232BA639|nr:hypothetical protein [Cognatishimia sp. SS12]MDC0739341.1 hypothetical protein [Cognatishimia sp. SS12]
MPEKQDRSWFSKAENCWLLIACGLGMLNLFLIALLWNVSGQLPKMDSLSISLTVLEIFLAVIAVSGFFLIRSAAMSRAEEEAARVAEGVAKREIADVAPPLVRRTVAEYMKHLEQKGGTTDTSDSTQDMMQALDREGDND